jgi:hypothetical protein
MSLPPAILEKYIRFVAEPVEFAVKILEQEPDTKDIRKNLTQGFPSHGNFFVSSQVGYTHTHGLTAFELGGNRVRIPQVYHQLLEYIRNGSIDVGAYREYAHYYTRTPANERLADCLLDDKLGLFYYGIFAHAANPQNFNLLSFIPFFDKFAVISNINENYLWLYKSIFFSTIICFIIILKYFTQYYPQIKILFVKKFFVGAEEWGIGFDKKIYYFF